MELLQSAAVMTDSGVANDFRGKSKKRTVTVISAEAWQQACDELGESLPWTTRRANLLVEGIDLPQRSGDLITIGDVQLQATMEVDPCSRMEEQFAGLKAALTPDWRGGVACTVLQPGTVSIGDAVSVSRGTE
jgi:MOSC domain-containing protein YiiM